VAKLRVLVVEDSTTVRQRLCEALASDPGIEIVGEASDGEQAIERCERLRPDVMTLDMILPVMNGVPATEHIMANFPTPILIVSASTNRGELFTTYEALAAGAVDVLEKPRADEPDDAEWDRRFIAAVKLVARIPVIRHPRFRLARLRCNAEPRLAARTQRSRLLALGASTGGPAAIVQVLSSLPVDYPIPILLVLHIGPPFDAAFVEWLGTRTRHVVRSAQDGEPLASLFGVRMAPAGSHLSVRGGCTRLSSEPERNSCRPSIDVLFDSLAREVGAGVAACLFTGMGRDGASGLLAIRNAGGLTFAQDEATSIVYGMPREAARLGAAQRILPLERIGPELAALSFDGKAAR
jgi:two-component system, chemotaxis family, protein-glutamate methylesterase/glutaminase